MLGIFSNENAYLKLNMLETVQTFDVIEIYYLKDNEKQIYYLQNSTITKNILLIKTEMTLFTTYISIFIKEKILKQ